MAARSDGPARNSARSRPSGREADQSRPVTITRGFTKHAAGSVLIAFGDTKVICTASLEHQVPPFMRGQGRGWITAEYGMLPASTHTRTDREAARGKQGGRTVEIQRLIGRSLRAAVDLDALGERTIKIDCDVLQADGGTRTASITGGFVALVLALHRLRESGTIARLPIDDYVAATSVGIVDGRPLADLAYAEDSQAEVDMNVVKTGSGRFIEVQGTAEGQPFDRAALDNLLALAGDAIDRLVTMQREVVGEFLSPAAV